jgi:hypothetical protein
MHEKNGSAYEDLLAEAIKLSADEKISLVKTLVPAPMQVVMGGCNNMSGNIVLQVNMSDRDTFADILKAISERLKTEK